MGAGSGIALKFLQWFNRGVQFACCALILSLTSYFLAAMSDHRIDIPTSLRAVEGISGAGVLYTALGIVLVCCLAGFILTSFIAIVLDIAFLGAFIYVATVYKHGASSCNGDSVDTVFGSGNANAKVSSTHSGSVPLPTYRTACKMESANLAVAIVVIVFFIISALTELGLGRHRKKEQRFGPSPANNYTSGYGSKRAGKTGLFGSLFRRRTARDAGNENELPVHTEPDQLRQSYNTDATHVDQNNGLATSTYPKYGETGVTGTGYNDYGVPTTNGATTNGYGNMGGYGNQHRYEDGTYNVQ